MSTSQSPQDPAGVSNVTRLVRLAAVAALIRLDLWTKALMFTWLDRSGPGASLPEGAEVWFNGHWRVPVIGDFLGWMISENKGAAWGIGDSMPWLLVGGRVVAVLVLLWLLVRTPQAQRMLALAYTLILAGATGNLWDNLFRDPPEGHPFGAVRDFIHMYFESFDYHYPTFNVADSCIAVGAVLLIWSGFRSDPEAAEEPGAAPA